MKMATYVSIEMSSGSEDAVDADVPGFEIEDKTAVLAEWRAECSWAE